MESWTCQTCKYIVIFCWRLKTMELMCKIKSVFWWICRDLICFGVGCSLLNVNNWLMHGVNISTNGSNKTRVFENYDFMFLKIDLFDFKRFIWSEKILFKCNVNRFIWSISFFWTTVSSQCFACKFIPDKNIPLLFFTMHVLW